MKKSKNLLSMPVISLKEGHKVGSVKNLVIAPEEKEVIALAIEQKGLFKELKYIPFSKIVSIGANAITINEKLVVQKATNIPYLISLLNEKYEVKSSKVIQENGDSLGQVEDYYIDEATGKLLGLEMALNFMDSFFRGKYFLDIAFVNTIGKEVVITKNEIKSNLVKIDGGFQDKIHNLKNSTEDIFDASYQKTRKIGSGLNKTFDKFIKRSEGKIPKEKIKPAKKTDETKDQEAYVEFKDNLLDEENQIK